MAEDLPFIILLAKNLKQHVHVCMYLGVGVGVGRAE